MRIGYTWQQVRDAEQSYLKSLYDKEEIWFAWYPVCTNEQNVAWLENVKIKYNIYIHDGLYRVGHRSLKSYYLIED